MASPLTEEELARIQAERDARVAQYWGVPAPDAPVPPAAYNPNPGAEGYQPNPGALVGVAPAARAPIGAGPAIPYEQQGGFARAFSTPPEGTTSATAINLDDTVAAQRLAQDQADADNQTFAPKLREPAPIVREMTSGIPAPGVAGAPAKPAATSVARGPSTPANADPYGVKAAQRGWVGTFGTREDAARRMAEAEQAKAAFIGDHTAELARRQSEDAAIAGLEQQAAADHFESRMTEIERQLDDVKSKKIDPARLMKETPGLGFLAVIGGAIGGFYQGATRSGENPFLKQLNTMIDRDISAQERDIDQQTKGVGAQASLLGQQRQLFQDTQAAKMAAKALYFQSAQEELKAEAARYDSPIYSARADDAIAQIEAEKQKLLMDIGQVNQRLAMSAAAGQFAKEKEVRARRASIWDAVFKETGNPALADQEAARQTATEYGLGGMLGPRTVDAGAGGLGKAGREELAKEQAKAQIEVGGALTSIEAARRDAAKISKGGIIGNAWAGMPAWASEGAREDANAREAYNVSVRTIAGAAWRLRTGGMEPKGEEQLEALEHPFKILPSDNEARVRGKIDALEKYLIESARSKGIEATTPDDRLRALGATKAGGR